MYMKTFYFCILLLVAGLFMSCNKGGGDAREITMATLLGEMTGRESLARYPDPYFVTRQFSSYDRETVNKDSASWFANWDRSQFIRTDSVNGRREFVMFDAAGPGAVVRFWVTVADYGDKGILRFYVDGAAEPVIEGEVLGIISGQKLVGSPLSESVSEFTDYKQRGHNLYLPVPYNKSLKITYESPTIIEPGKNSGEAFYYNINYRTYDKGARVKSFSRNDLTEYKSLIDETCKKLLDLPSSDSLGKKTLKSVDLSSGENSITLSGPGAVAQLSVKLVANTLPQALRSTILSVTFDSNRTVWVPVGDFFGTGNRLSPYRTFYTQVTKDSVMTCFWIMPYKKSCVIKLENVNRQKVMSTLEVTAMDWQWDDRSMYFGAGWSEYNRLFTGKARDMSGTDEQFDVNFVKLTGKGVYVGDALTLFNSVGDWWGEGDEKVYIDGEKFPSHIGTGTEDYYGYAWCMHNFFEHPFIAQPDGSGATLPGHVSNVRFRGLDAMPFRKSLVFDMEIWHWASTYINYAPATFWYMLPGGKSNRKDEPENAAKTVVMHKNELVSNKPNEKGIIEGEFMNVSLTGGLEKSQSIPSMKWSNGAHLFWRDARAGDKAVLKFIVEEAGNYSVSANMTMAHDYGRFRVMLNGAVVMPLLDTYSENLISNVFDFGKINLKKGENEIVFIQLEKNNKSVNYFLGMDYLMIKPN